MKKHLLFCSVILLLLFLLMACENECIHTDIDKNHKCDHCEVDYTAECTDHADTDKNHKCDYCEVDYTAECVEHGDTDKNHKCDYCDVDYTAECVEHGDSDKNRKCDYCNADYIAECIEHADTDKNHKCDYCERYYDERGYRLIANGKEIDKAHLMEFIEYTDTNPDNDTVYTAIHIPFVPVCEAFGATAIEMLPGVIVITMNGISVTLDQSNLTLISEDSDFNLLDDIPPGSFYSYKLSEGELLVSNDILIDVFQYEFGIYLEYGDSDFSNYFVDLIAR